MDYTFDFEFFDEQRLDKYCFIVGYHGKGEEVVFPAFHEGKPVIAISLFPGDFGDM